MKRLAATAITLMMTAAIGTAAASPFDHNNRPQAPDYSARTSSHGPQGSAYNIQTARYAYNRGAAGVSSNTNTNARYRGNVAGRRWDGHDYDGDGRWNRYQYRPRGYYGYYGYGGYGGYRSYRPYYYPTVSVAYVGGPAYYPASYYAAPYAYDNGAYAYDNGPYAYGNGYAACDPRVRYDDNGGKIVGALIGGVLGNTVGKGDGRTAATVAGAAIGYGIGASVDNDRRYDDCGSY